MDNHEDLLILLPQAGNLPVIVVVKRLFLPQFSIHLMEQEAPVWLVKKQIDDISE